MQLKDIPKRLGYILSAQWSRDGFWTLFTILLARHNQATLGQIVLALSFGYLLKTIVDVGLNDYLLSSFARGDCHPRKLLNEVTWLKLAVLVPSVSFLWLLTGEQGYTLELRLMVLAIAGGLGLDAVCDSFFALCQARGRQDVEMRIRIPAGLTGIGFGIVAVLLEAQPLCIALYKPIESLLCIFFAVYALRRNPLRGFGFAQIKELAAKMRKGIIFTGMALCAMFYNKINVIFLKQYGGDSDVGAYGVAWETLEGIATLVSGALLGKVIFPLLSQYWAKDRKAFSQLASKTAKSLWACALPIMFLLCCESDRFLPFVYGPVFENAVTAQRLLTPCIATAFLHNLAAYAMIGMGAHLLLFFFYVSGLVLNIVLCCVVIPAMPLEGCALALTLTKVFVAILTIGYFQYKAHPMTLGEWAMLIFFGGGAVLLWWGCGTLMPREVAELVGLLPLLLLLWKWRPPAPFEHEVGKNG